MPILSADVGAASATAGTTGEAIPVVSIAGSPSFSKPFELQVQPGTVINPNIVEFFRHPMNLEAGETGHFGTEFITLLHPEFGTPVDYQIEDYFTGPIYKSSPVCLEKAGSLPTILGGYIGPFLRAFNLCESLSAMISPALSKKIDEEAVAAPKCKPVYETIKAKINGNFTQSQLCDDPINFIQGLVDSFGEVSEYLTSLPMGNPLECSYGDVKNNVLIYSLVGMFDDILYAMCDENPFASIFEKVGKALGILNLIVGVNPTTIDQYNAQIREDMAGIFSEVLLADIYQSGGGVLNSATYASPYNAGFPYAAKNVFSGTPVDDGIVLVSYSSADTGAITDVLKASGILSGDPPPIGSSLSYYRFNDDGKLEYRGTNISWLQNTDLTTAAGIPLVSGAGKCSFMKKVNGVYETPTKEKMYAAGCWPDDQSVGVKYIDINRDGLGDLVLINRGKLPEPDPNFSFATIYLGKETERKNPVFVDKWDYDTVVKIGSEPYGSAVIDEVDLLVTSTMIDAGTHVITKLEKNGNGKVISKLIHVETPQPDMSPYQITAVSLEGACDGFAFTSAVINTGFPGYPESSSVLFSDRFTVYAGSVGPDGGCGKYELVGHFKTPVTQIIAEDEVNNNAQLAAIAFVPGDSVRGFSSGIIVGDQYLYSGSEAYVHFFPIVGNTIDKIGARSYRADAGDMDYKDPNKTGGGVTQLSADSYGNLGAILGYPVVFQDARPACGYFQGKLQKTTDFDPNYLDFTCPDYIGTCHQNDLDCDGLIDSPASSCQKKWIAAGCNANNKPTAACKAIIENDCCAGGGMPDKEELKLCEIPKNCEALADPKAFNFVFVPDCSNPENSSVLNCYVNDLNCNGKTDPVPNACLENWYANDCGSNHATKMCKAVVNNCCELNLIKEEDECAHINFSNLPPSGTNIPKIYHHIVAPLPISPVFSLYGILNSPNSEPSDQSSDDQHVWYIAPTMPQNNLVQGVNSGIAALTRFSNKLSAITPDAAPQISANLRSTMQKLAAPQKNLAMQAQPPATESTVLKSTLGKGSLSTEGDEATGRVNVLVNTTAKNVKDISMLNVGECIVRAGDQGSDFMQQKIAEWNAKLHEVKGFENVDLFVAENGTFKATCATQIPYSGDSSEYNKVLGVTPKWALVQRTPGMPLDNYFNKSKYQTRPGIHKVLNKDLLILPTPDSAGPAKGLLPDINSLPRELTGEMYYMTDVAAHAKAMNYGDAEGHRVSLGEEADPFFVVDIVKASAQGDISAVLPEIDPSRSKFEGGGTIFEIQGYAGLDLCRFGPQWPDGPCAPVRAKRFSDPDTTIAAIKECAEKLDSVTYAKAMNCVAEAQYDATDWLKIRYEVVQEGVTNIPVYLNVVSDASFGSVQGGGCSLIR